RMATGSPSGRSARWFASAAASWRPTTSRRPGRRWQRRWRSAFPTPRSAAGSSGRFSPSWASSWQRPVRSSCSPLGEPSSSGLPAAATKTIVGRADGMPLYAVETVRMLLADGRLALDGERYVPIGDLTRLAVPETLTALIASRLDGLPPDEHALVSDAAVLGQ